VATLTLVDPEQWSAWHSVLDEHKQLELVREDLRMCNPQEDQFTRLRRCVSQRVQEEEPHTAKDYPGTRRREPGDSSFG
jgi:hypothetical protein